MAYKTNNSMKGERKMGMGAMREMVNKPGFDPQAALAVAQQNLDAFGKLDDLDDAAFIRCMKDMRANHPALYPVFWWWRDSEEKAGRRQETDSDQPESRYRTFMITQFLREPFSDDWEDDRKTLRPGVEPWITEEQIADGLNHATIKRWAWIWHDRDIYTEQDEVADRNNRVKAGELKFKHAHIMLDIPAKVAISVVARWFNVPPQQVTVMRGRGAFLDGVEYLPHESPRAVEQHMWYYLCKNTKVEGPTRCTYTKHVRQDELDGQVRAIVEDAFRNVDFTERMRQKIGTRSGIDELNAELDGLQDEKKKEERQKAKLAGKIAALDADDPLYDDMYETLHGILHENIASIAELDRKIEDVSIAIHNAAHRTAIAEHTLELTKAIAIDMMDELLEPEQARRIFHLLIESIQIFPEPMPDGLILKRVKFRIPLEYEGDEVWGAEVDVSAYDSLPDKNHDETIVLLQRENS